jgi:hypothetical protein
MALLKDQGKLWGPVDFKNKGESKAFFSLWKYWRERGPGPWVCCMAHPIPHMFNNVECKTCRIELLIKWEIAVISVYFQGLKLLFYLDHNSFSLGIKQLFWVLSKYEKYGTGLHLTFPCQAGLLQRPDKCESLSSGCHHVSG